MKEKWINIVKCLAIFCVMIDHTAGILYTAHEVQLASFCSVPLFILAMGVTTYWSYENSKEKLGIKVIKRVKEILVPYIIAVFLYMLSIYRTFDMDGAVTYFWHFDISDPLYYVMLYIQLLLTSPVIYYLINCIFKEFKLGKLLKSVFALVLGCGILLVGILLSNHTNIFSIYGGGGKLLGGTYLLLLYIGMLIGVFYEKIKNIKFIYKVVLMAAAVCGTILWFRFMCVNDFALDQRIMESYINPPGPSLMIYAIIVFFAVMLAIDLLERTGKKAVNIILKPFDYIGSHTLYIFFYHKWWLDFVIPHIPENIRFCNKIISWIMYFGIMTVGALIIGMVIHKMIEIIYAGYNMKGHA